MADVSDFTSFVVPVRNGIKGDRGFCGPIRVPLREELCSLPLCFTDEIINLHGIFFDLLSKLEKCLVKIESRVERAKKHVGETIFVGSQFLALLKELNSISKLYHGCEEVFWESMKQRKGALCYLIVKCAKRLIPEVKDDYDELHEMLIDRANLLAESFEYIINADLESLRAGLFMEFKNEEATGPGVLREWFFLVCQAIFNPQNPLFVACPNDRRRFFPNPGHSITLEDIRDADPFLYSSCKQILEMDAEAVDQDALGLTFVHEIEELGTRRVVELCLGGKSVVVNSKNRRQYVDSLIQHRFVKETAEQSFFRCLNPEDLDLMLHGSESEISVDDWKAHTDYNGFKATDVQIFWFWKVCYWVSFFYFFCVFFLSEIHQYEVLLC
ncbi:E3 ubiquitin-protein ligase upl5 [Phtheirospermum japonicum]|uniref:HECT-type E3 ubiquitin transferase n=1 Tax=Phtheirospermum japonicum TaxID=374723 RepID=A0A830CB83_9LAMI|nr:E3 ubiquitin-protein ligase upl5 [Phtheirospermum japonicum]